MEKLLIFSLSFHVFLLLTFNLLGRETTHRVKRALQIYEAISSPYMFTLYSSPPPIFNIEGRKRARTCEISRAYFKEKFHQNYES